MPVSHTVNQGECLSSIALDYGFFWKTIWTLPDNAKLQELRKNPNILLPGDILFVPEKSLKEVACSTDARHAFVLRGTPATLRLQVFDGEKPRVNQTYVLVVDGVFYHGKTDHDGKMEHPIEPRARKGKLIIGPDRYEYALDLGNLDPITELSGVKGRLNNLGFDCGDPDNEDNARTKAALKAFQRRFNLPETGIADVQTRKQLEELHDRVSQFPPGQTNVTQGVA